MKDSRPLFYIETYGCQMNEHDSETIAGMLSEMGYEETLAIEKADIIIINTCCVREKAESKVFGRLGNLKALKEKKPDLIISVCGCMVQQQQIADKIKKNMPHVNLVFGTLNLHRLPELIKEVRETELLPLVELWDNPGKIVEGLPVKREGKIRAYVNITFGCDNYCAYCIVPYVRGKERSRKLQEVIREVREIDAEAIKEIVFLGQNVNAYGRDLNSKVNFSDLLIKTNNITENVQRIRFTTSHPKDFNEEMVDVTANLDKVCEHYHLPVQAGSNRILKLMNRGYSREQYLGLANLIREKIPGASITTDIIVGFPGENEKDFEETLDLVKQVQFDAAYTFIFSPRPGTKAAEMPDTVPIKEKKKWFQCLVKTQNEISLKRNQELCGKTLEVLVEGRSKTNPDKLAGRTRTSKIVIFEGDPDWKGKIIPVTIEKAQTFNLIGSREEN